MAQNALIKITIDPSKGVATINGVKVALTDLAKAQKQVNEETEKGREIIKDSLEYWEKQRAALIAQRRQLSTTSDEYDAHTQSIRGVNLEIAKIVQNKEREGAAVKGSFQWYEQEIAIRRRLQKTMVDSNAAVQAYEQQIIKLRAEQRALTTGTRLTGKGMQSMSSSAGLAGAAATEFGRAVGDAQYGIQGVSNNVQQLSALFTDLVQQEGSVKKAFDLFTSTLMGPAGVLVAVSLVTTAIEYFVRRNKEAEDTVKDFNEAIFLQTGALTVLSKKYKDQNTSEEQRISLLYQLALANKDVLNILRDETLTMDERIKRGDQFIDNQLKLNDARERLANATKILEENEGKAIATTEEYNKAKEISEALSKKDTRAINVYQASLTTEQKKKLDAANATIALYEANRDQADIAREIIGLEEMLGYITEDSSKKKEKEAAIVKNSIKDYEKRIEKIKEEMENVDLNSDAYERLEKELNSLNKTYEALLVTQRQLDIEMAEAAIEAADVRIKAGMDSIKNEQQNYAKRKELSFREQGRGDEYLSWSIGFYKRLSEDEAFSSEERLKFKELYLDAVDALNKREEKAAKDTEKKQKEAQDKKLAEFKANMKALEDISDFIGTINGFLDAEAQREIDRETNKTNAINDQLRIRLANEQMSADQRDAINQQIARNESALVEKENAINEKRFKQQKAFNIAMAIIDTYVAANMALKDETIPNTFVRIAAMISIIATGLANVATISRQKFVAKALPSPRLSSQSSGGADTTTGPQFNLIGSTGENQLAAAIAAVQKEPVKAYVVSSEVSSAQEMERKTVASASI